jgi:peptidoglycan/xylan/chitin deacetylase (PgdA/CDA1 family)
MHIVKKAGLILFRRYKYLQRELAGVLGMHENFFRHARGSRIIVYHGVCQKDPLRYNTLFVTEKTFEAHLRFYKQYFQIVSLADFYKGNFGAGKFTVSLTFDDGFANNCKYVLPLLEKYEIPATFFVTAIRQKGHDILWNDFLTLSSVSGPRQIVFGHEIFNKNGRNTYVSSTTQETLSETLKRSGFDAKEKMMELLQSCAWFRQNKELDDYWLQMTIGEIKKAAASSFITIGSHSCCHNDLAKISLPEMIAELNESKLFLESITHKPITQLAFPYGSYSPVVIEEAVNAGYKYLLATEFLYPENGHNDLMKERMGINPFISVRNQMFCIVKGNYE